MKTITAAAAARSGFTKFLEMARREPVVVTKNDRPVGVFISMEDLEDFVWGERALKAHAEGYVGVDKSEEFIDDLLNAPD